MLAARTRSGRSLPDPVPQVGHTRGGNHASALEFEVRAFEVVEQPRASSKENRRDVQLHLVDEPRSKELLGDIRATRQSDVLAAGSLFGLRERRLDAVRDEGEGLSLIHI